MAVYLRVYDSHHLLADCQEPGSAPETLRSVIEYGLPFFFTVKLGTAEVGVWRRCMIRLYRVVYTTRTLVIERTHCFDMHMIDKQATSYDTIRDAIF